MDTYIERFRKIRNLTIDLCKPLAVEDFVVQPVADVSPPKWHLGHTTWFFEAIILQNYDEDYSEYNKSFSYLFNSYYESVGDRIARPNRGFMTRPTVEEIIQYRQFVDTSMEQFINKNKGKIDKKLGYILELGLQHEQQHQELLVTDLKYILFQNPLFPVYKDYITDKKTTEIKLSDRFIEMKDGIYEIGYGGNGFCFDNELEKHKVYLRGYRFQDRLITNKEFIKFIEDGGYRRFNFWLSDGWDWVKKNNIHAPLYWHRMDELWFTFTLAGLEEVNPEEPVIHVSYYEADAFARWRGKRLLTEPEWEAACMKVEPEPPENANFIDKDHFRAISPQAGCTQLFGDAWEWTGSAYLAYPGFQEEEGAIGEYNGKFMVNQMVLKGGSCATSRDHIRSSYRNFFHPHLRWQFTGIRLGESI